MVGWFFDSLGKAIVSYNIKESAGEFRLVTSGLHTVVRPVISREVEVTSYPDMARGSIADSIKGLLEFI